VASREIEEAALEGFRQAKEELVAANPVAEELIDGLYFIRSQAGAGEGFDLTIKQSSMNNVITINTSILTPNSCNSHLTIIVAPAGRITLYNGSGGPQDHDGANVAALVQLIAKQAAMGRQVVPAPPAPPAEDAFETALQMRAQINQSTARNKTGQRSPGS